MPLNFSILCEVIVWFCTYYGDKKTLPLYYICFISGLDYFNLELICLSCLTVRVWWISTRIAYKGWILTFGKWNVIWSSIVAYTEKHIILWCHSFISGHYGKFLNELQYRKLFIYARTVELIVSHTTVYVDIHLSESNVAFPYTVSSIFFFSEFSLACPEILCSLWCHSVISGHCDLAWHTV